jgi:hypothetical protein
MHYFCDNAGHLAVCIQAAHSKKVLECRKNRDAQLPTSATICRKKMALATNWQQLTSLHICSSLAVTESSNFSGLGS